MKERTLAIIKPDAVAARSAGRIIDIIQHTGLEIVGMKLVKLAPERAAAFYAVHKDKEFFKPLVGFMCSGPIIVLALEGENAISMWREIMGATDPAKAKKGTIRQLFGEPAVPGKVTRNATHGSDAPATAAQEIAFFFNSSELC
jgi:nucleoside-diphosphate kinase